MSSKKEISKLLDQLADLMEFNLENKFKVNAFRNGSRIIGRMEGDIEDKIEDGSIKDIKGIGKGLLAVIYEYHETGKSSDYEEFMKNIPAGVLDIFRVRGIGPRKIRALYDDLQIDSLEKLEQACRDNLIADLKGFGSKTQEKILDEILRLKKQTGFRLLDIAVDRGEEIKAKLEELDSSIEVIFTGELRRNMEVISVLEILVITPNEKKALDKLTKLYKINKLEYNSSIESYMLDVDELTRIVIYLSEPKYKEWALFVTTGSETFLKKMNAPAKKQYKDESEIFKSLNFPYIIPEMREENYFDAPEKLRKNSDLELNKFQGFFHFHTTMSDGNNSLAEMVDEVEKTGFKYAVVSDHSKAAFYANGLNEDRILLQRKEIDEFNKTSNLKVYHGIESDILKDGSLDYEEDVLKEFQFIVASVHSIFNLSEDEMTARIIKAVENPYTDLLAHPSGRLLLERDGYKLNHKKVIDACSANDVAIEINANTRRLDLDWRHLYYAREKGCLISINPDAHSTRGVHDINYGISIARKGGVQTKEVLNCFSENEFIEYINRKTKRITK